MFAVFQALGTQPCWRDILNKSHKGEHNSGNFFRSKGGIPSGSHDIKVLEAVRDFLMSVTENIGVGIALFSVRAEEGRIAIIRDKNTIKKVIK